MLHDIAMSLRAGWIAARLAFRRRRTLKRESAARQHADNLGGF